MPQPRFDRLCERLLRAGIAPRHVRRYARELADHYDDLVREEIANGAARELAGTKALARLGSNDDLAEAMLARPGLRSLSARYPWAVFGLGPVAALALSFAAALGLELGLIQSAQVWAPLLGITPGPAAAKGFTQALLVWNTLAMYGAPLLLAGLFYGIGSRQRLPPAWIVTGVMLVCILGSFQNLIFYDTGCRGCGHLLVQSAFVPPFPHVAEGFARAAMNLVLAGGVWWLARRKTTSTLTLPHTARM